MDANIFDLIKKANETTLNKHGDLITLERAVFLSWWCDKGDCAFCYMSTQKEKIKDPSKARRNVSNIYAEAEMCKRLDWNIEFLSGGYESFTTQEIKQIAIADLGGMIISSVITIVLAIKGFGYWAIAAQQVSQVFFKMIIIWCCSKWWPSLKSNFALIKELFAFSFAIIISSLLNYLSKYVYNFCS